MLIPYRQGTQWGYSDSLGNIVIEPKYQAVKPFEDQFAHVKSNNKWGMINAKGNEVILCQYDELGSVSQGIICAKKGKWGFINTLGNPVTPFIYDYAKPFAEGLSQVRIDGNWGYINDEGILVIPPKYEDCTSFVGGYAEVWKDFKKKGLIDNQGTEIIPAIYWQEWNEERFFIDKLKINRYPSLKETISPVTLGISEKYGFIRNTDFSVTFKYDCALAFSEGLAAVNKNGKWGFIDYEENLTIPYIYDSVNSFFGGLALVKSGGKYGYIDRQGTLIIPFSFDKAMAFFDGLAAVMVGNKWGYINLEGDIVVPVDYEYALFYTYEYDPFDGFGRPFRDGFTSVNKGQDWWIIDKKGNKVSNIYSGISLSRWPYTFDNGITNVSSKNGKTGYIDAKGNEFWKD